MKFVRILKAHWETTYKDEVKEMPAIEATIRAAKVPCENGQFRELGRTYLPLENLKKEARHIGIAEHVPFLNLSTNLDYVWHERLEIARGLWRDNQANLQLYIRILDIIRKSQDNIYLIRQMVSKVYQSIGNICSREMKDDVYEAFVSDSYVYIPEY